MCLVQLQVSSTSYLVEMLKKIELYIAAFSGVKAAGAKEKEVKIFITIVLIM